MHQRAGSVARGIRAASRRWRWNLRRRRAWPRTAGPSNCARSPCQSHPRFQVTPVPVASSRGCARTIRRSKGAREKLRLDFNENPIGCSPAVRRALAQASPRRTISSYPEQASVRRKMAKSLRRQPGRIAAHQRHGRSAQPRSSTPSSKPNDKVLFVEPTYAMYRFYSELAGAKIVAPRYTREHAISHGSEVLAAAESARREFSSCRIRIARPAIFSLTATCAEFSKPRTNRWS